MLDSCDAGASCSPAGAWWAQAASDSCNCAAHHDDNNGPAPMTLASDAERVLVTRAPPPPPIRPPPWGAKSRGMTGAVPKPSGPRPQLPWCPLSRLFSECSAASDGSGCDFVHCMQHARARTSSNF